MLKLCYISMLGGLLLVLLALPDTAPVAQTTPQAAAATRHPDADLDGLYQAGRAAYEAGDTLDALGQYQEAVDKFQQAAGLFEQVVQADPNNFKAIVNWGAAEARQGKPAEAVLKYQQALALVPDHVNRAETLYNWGTALERLGRHQEAIGKFDQAIALKADLLSPTLQDYLQRHRLRQQDSEINAPAADSPTRQ